eukprot:GDKJ01019107.1.p1 GENE.GDKJ01019107.1~~GDKJ01019107.1.p1  ORF type:complete len:711 (+),score=174.93 GDKJ01019107.1:31-2133(+)
MNQLLVKDESCTSTEPHLNRLNIKDPDTDWTEDEKQLLYDVIRSSRSDTNYVWTPIDRCLFAKKQLPHKSLRDIASRCAYLIEQEFRLQQGRRKLLEPGIIEPLTESVMSQIGPLSLFVQLRAAELALDDAEKKHSIRDPQTLETMERVAMTLGRCSSMVKVLPQAHRMCALPNICLTPFPVQRQLEMTEEFRKFDGYELLADHVNIPSAALSSLNRPGSHSSASFPRSAVVPPSSTGFPFLYPPAPPPPLYPSSGPLLLPPTRFAPLTPNAPSSSYNTAAALAAVTTAAANSVAGAAHFYNPADLRSQQPLAQSSKHHVNEEELQHLNNTNKSSGGCYAQDATKKLKEEAQGAHPQNYVESDVNLHAASSYLNPFSNDNAKINHENKLQKQTKMNSLKAQDEEKSFKENADTERRLKSSCAADLVTLSAQMHTITAQRQQMTATYDRILKESQNRSPEEINYYLSLCQESKQQIEESERQLLLALQSFKRQNPLSVFPPALEELWTRNKDDRFPGQSTNNSNNPTTNGAQIMVINEAQQQQRKQEENVGLDSSILAPTSHANQFTLPPPPAPPHHLLPFTLPHHFLPPPPPPPQDLPPPPLPPPNLLFPPTNIFPPPLNPTQQQQHPLLHLKPTAITNTVDNFHESLPPTASSFPSSQLPPTTSDTEVLTVVKKVGPGGKRSEQIQPSYAAKKKTTASS